jgi:hypothetical protein
MFVIRYLAGRCWNGAQRDAGRLYHAVAANEDGFGKAVCGAVPGRRSNGWAAPAWDEAEVTCPKCRKRLAALEARKAPRTAWQPGDGVLVDGADGPVLV